VQSASGYLTKYSLQRTSLCYSKHPTLHDFFPVCSTTCSNSAASLSQLLTLQWRRGQYVLRSGSPAKSNQLLLVTRPTPINNFIDNFLSYPADRQTDRQEQHITRLADVYAVDRAGNDDVSRDL